VDTAHFYAFAAVLTALGGLITPIAVELIRTRRERLTSELKRDGHDPNVTRQG
jgi:hypothetical protein